jgi:hypothetical protein
MNWQVFINDHAVRNGFEPFSFMPRATVEDVQSGEVEFGRQFPDDLVAFWLQANGAKDKYGWWFIWDVNHLLEVNHTYRSGEDWLASNQSFENLLLFSDAASNGDMFAYKAHTPTGVELSDLFPWDGIYFWDHEDDHRVWAAPNLESWVRWYLSGKRMDV